MIPKNKIEVVADCETDGLDPTKIHCTTVNDLTNGSMFSMIKYDKMREYLSNPDMLLIGHNFYLYDLPTWEKLLNIKIKATVVDTLGLSWYLYPTRNLHGLADWGEYFGIPKPKIDDWENLSVEEYVHRCEEDVKINTKLWQKMKKDLANLYGDADWWKAVDYINFKMSCAKLKQDSKWKLKVKECTELRDFFDNKAIESKDSLQEAMPKVPIITKKVKPKKPYKKDGTLSKIGEGWDALVKEHNKPFNYSGEIEVVTGYSDPNAGSSIQVKNWLFDLGWSPTLYNYVRNKETGEVKKIPQVRNKDTGDLCANIVKLSEDYPSLKLLEDLSILTHRKSICDGFLKDVDKNGYVVARIQGLTNSLRWKHKVCLNLPSLRRPYGEEIRGLLVARSEEYELVGSDMSSLEDRTKQHYIFPHDPEYVKTMQVDGFDPHCDIAEEAGMMTKWEVNAYKHMESNDLSTCEIGGVTYDKKTLSTKRHGAKSANYGCTYGIGVEGLARRAGISNSQAEVIHNAYWKRNWAIKVIASNCEVKQCLKVKWLWNPVAKIYYYLKKDKDRFSLLNQSTGTFLFDQWVKEIVSRRKQLTCDTHDDIVLEVKKGYRPEVTKLLKDCMQEVNRKFNLNRDLDCDIEFGDDYSEIH